MRARPLGQDAAIIGGGADRPLLCPRPHPVGGERLVDWLNGEMLPRDLLE